MALPRGLPPHIAAHFASRPEGPLGAVLVEGDAGRIGAAVRDVAGLPGPVVSVHAAGADGMYPLHWLLEEVSTSINTTAAGGNASLMMIGGGLVKGQDAPAQAEIGRASCRERVCKTV